MVSSRNSSDNKKNIKKKLRVAKTIKRLKEVETDKSRSTRINIRQKQLKIWEQYYEGQYMNFSGKVKYWCDMDVPSIIISKLNSEQLDMMKNTCFGKFFDGEKRKMFSQLIHHALLREIYQMNNEEVWFLLGDVRVRFGLQEFYMISGLNGTGKSDISEFDGIDNALLSKYFQHERLTRAVIKRKYQDATFDDNAEAVKVSVIFFVFNFLLATVEDNLIDKVLLNFLSYGDINNYPWGKVAFEMSKQSLCHALKGNFRNVEMGVVEYNFYKERSCRFYKLNGLSYVFQVFLFETIPKLKESGFCIDNQISEVRLFRWKENENAPSFKRFKDNIFCTSKLKIEVLIPNIEERAQSKGSGFKEMKRGNVDFQKIVDSRVKPLEIEVKKIKEKMRRFRNDVRVELKEFQTNIIRIINSSLKKGVRLVGREMFETGEEDDVGCRDKDADVDDAHVGAKDEDDDVGCKDKDADVDADAHADAKDEEVMVEQVTQDRVSTNQNTVKDIVLYTPNKGSKIMDQHESRLDDISFTTQDINQIMEVERNACRPGGRPFREVKKGPALRTPYTTHFRATINIQGPKKGVSVLPTVCMRMPSTDETTSFDQWFKIGYNKRKRRDKFPDQKDLISPAFKFGVFVIRSKMWFYKLLTAGQYLDNLHIDIYFYYMRKLAIQHIDDIPIRVTTTDCWFHMKITHLYNEYHSKNEDESILFDDEVIASYILGWSMMKLNTSWVNVDYVLFPIHMSSPEHWFLLVFEIPRRLLVVYNSFQPNGTQIKANIFDTCEPYIYILPIILSNCGFWKARSDIDLSSDGYVGKSEKDNIELEIATGLPEQIESDCGMFTICFAEHVLFQKVSEMPQPFPVVDYRKKLCVNLFTCANLKQLGGYESDRKNT